MARITRMYSALTLVRKNRRLAHALWGQLSHERLCQLHELTNQYGFSLCRGDLNLLNDSWYITHSGLLHIAQRKRCSGIQTEVASELSDPVLGRWVVKAIVFKTPRSKGFVGYGDADPGNVSPVVRGAELRIAETRAVNRALRKAYGIGICSVEELGAGQTKASPAPAPPSLKNNGNGQPRLRDRLLLLIRQHRLDAEQVKRYAAQFCGTLSLREASRAQVERFVNHLATLAAENRDKLLAELSVCSEEAAARVE